VVPPRPGEDHYGRMCWHLGQHHITYSEVAFRHETQHTDALARSVQLLDVHLHAMTNAV
jgi:hypothetical protein